MAPRTSLIAAAAVACALLAASPLSGADAPAGESGGWRIDHNTDGWLVLTTATPKYRVIFMCSGDLRFWSDDPATARSWSQSLRHDGEDAATVLIDGWQGRGRVIMPLAGAMPMVAFQILRDDADAYLAHFRTGATATVTFNNHVLSVPLAGTARLVHQIADACREQLRDAAGEPSSVPEVDRDGQPVKRLAI